MTVNVPDFEEQAAATSHVPDPPCNDNIIHIKVVHAVTITKM